ncbi:MAG: hypothetical protein KZQ94_10420 [Candidatus Thiodiazotropha sp. (ex Troendleina suluensis)]|nr:hypothetical protein [Candidatus Thiodiazotropha sp. (ex Troendleina suluensis)]
MVACIQKLNQGSTGWLSVSFLDRSGQSVAPAAVTYSVRCLTNARYIREDVSVIAPTADIEIKLTPSDNTLIDPVNNDKEQRRVIVTAFYGSPDDKSVQSFDYFVKNENQ